MEKMKRKCYIIRLGKTVPKPEPEPEPAPESAGSGLGFCHPNTRTGVTCSNLNPNGFYPAGVRVLPVVPVALCSVPDPVLL